MMPRTSVLSLLAVVTACASSNTPPSAGRTGPNGTGVFDSLRRNTVIENARPDASARAGVLVVANQQGASATIVNVATMQPITTIPVGEGPHEAAVSPDGRWGVVTIYGTREAPGNTLSVIDLAAMPLPVMTRSISLGDYKRPHGIAFVQEGNKLVVTSETSQRLVIVDFASGRVDTALATNAAGSHMVAVRRDGKRAWTANMSDGSITEFNLEARRTVRKLTAAPDDEGIATTPGGILVWVGSNTAKTVTIIDTEKGAPIGTIHGFGFPYRIGISRTGRVAIVNDPTGNKIWVFEVGSRRELAQIDLNQIDGKLGSGAKPGQEGAGPEGIAFDPIADVAYVTLHGTNQVIAVDLVKFKLVGAGSVGAGPDGIAYSPLVRRE